MRISINVTDFSWPGGATAVAPALAAVVDAADAAGVDTVWVGDHLMQADPTCTPDEPVLEAYTTLGYLAARTEHVRIGTMVTGVTYRPPALLVKAVTTLDVLSGGRAWLGFGAAYREDEAYAMGLSLPPAVERVERLEETLRLAQQMWAGDTGSFDGRHFTLDYPVCSPQPVQRPRPAVLVGGVGDGPMLRLAAQYADACNFFDVPDGGLTLRRELDVLADHCAAAGRPYWEVEKTVTARMELAEPAESVAERCESFAEYGIEHVVFAADGPWTPEAVEAVGEAVPVVAQIRPNSEVGVW